MTQQCLHSFVYRESDNDAKIKVNVAKKFHTWQLVACHKIGPGVGDTPVEVFQDFIDFLHSNGINVKTLSDVYTEYPLEHEPHIDFSVNNYEITYDDMVATNKQYIKAKQNLNEDLPISVTLDRQCYIPRTISWKFNSHTNISAYSLIVKGRDAKDIPHIIILTQADGWSGETSVALKELTIQMVSRIGTGVGDTLDIGVGSKVGLPHKIFYVSDVFKIEKNGVNYPTNKYRIDIFYDTVDLSISEAIKNGDSFKIWYKSNLDMPFIGDLKKISQ